MNGFQEKLKYVIVLNVNLLTSTKNLNKEREEKTVKKISGVYRILNIVSGKQYIGSSKDIKRREYDHFWSLKGNRHNNEHLQNAYNKHGEKNFIFKVLLICSEEQLMEQEQRLINETKERVGWNNLYNINPLTSKIIITEETRQKMSVAAKERVKNGTSNAGKKGKNNHSYGKKLSRKHKEIISKANKGKTVSKETRKKMSEAKIGKPSPMKGKKFSKEHRENISRANKGKPGLEGEDNPMYGKKGKDHPAYGRHHDKKTKQKISVSLKKKYNAPGAKEKLSEASKRGWITRRINQKPKEKKKE